MKHSAKTTKLTRLRIALIVTALCSVIGLILAMLHVNVASAEPYPIKGFDVSHHQGQINWKKISPQQYQFVYLKATEGGDFKGPVP